MARLIDGDALKEDLKQKILDNRIYNQDVKTFVKVLMEISIDNLPTVEPVKRGKWLKIPQGCRWWMCTQCNHIIDRIVLPHYCERCGAKMDGESE